MRPRREPAGETLQFKDFCPPPPAAADDIACMVSQQFLAILGALFPTGIILRLRTERLADVVDMKAQLLMLPGGRAAKGGKGPGRRSGRLWPRS